jgi:hypothetical protein
MSIKYIYTKPIGSDSKIHINHKILDEIATNNSILIEILRCKMQNIKRIKFGYSPCISRVFLI